MTKDLSGFLSNYSLYTKFEVFDFSSDVELIGSTFQSYCKNDLSITTFKIISENNDINARKGRIMIGGANVLGNSTHEFEFIQHYTGECQFCKKNNIHFLINGFTERDKEGSKRFYLRKVGQLPAPEINLDSNLESFLSEEDKGFYKKALLNLQYGYGIGAFSYFRRIVQNEIERIANKLADTNSENKEDILKAIEDYKQSKVMKKLINDITKYLPKRILDIGSNPLLVLYGQLSEGIHNLSEEECIERSKAIDVLLRFVFKELRQDSDFSSAKDALKELNKFS
jgi:hypothetical protein